MLYCFAGKPNPGFQKGSQQRKLRNTVTGFTKSISPNVLKKKKNIFSLFLGSKHKLIQQAIREHRLLQNCLLIN